MKRWRKDDLLLAVWWGLRLVYQSASSAYSSRSHNPGAKEKKLSLNLRERNKRWALFCCAWRYAR